MIRRGLTLAAVALALAAVVQLRAPELQEPPATVGHAGALEATSTTAAPAPAPAPTTTTTSAKPRTTAATRSTTVVRSDGGSVTIVNEGSASVNTGGNVVIGPPDATVTNGPATAVGNVSRP